jgi:phosphoribosylaminoimidazole (AIR) synthetase
VLPGTCDAVVHLGSWPVPPLFQLVRDACTSLDAHELHRTLNMGIGMVLVCAADDVATVQGLVGETTWVIGELTPGTRQVHLS